MSVPLETERVETALLRSLRAFVLLLFLLGLLGTGAELLLLGHTEDRWQYTPLVLMALALLVLGWRIIDRRANLRVFQLLMLAWIVSGFIGLWLHYKANIEFELEMYPDLKGMALFWKAIKGTTPPSLAPGTMIQLGLLGLVYTYRHPALTRKDRKEN
jgi:hypothetical protein